ncbi:flagellar hook-length control protein FliK [Desulfovibrio sp. OttesenSCG-928-G15]|nr:flagellar hook-length control protein FliK [Desulfovibrio sp. OttesenSCG-928-G15]
MQNLPAINTSDVKEAMFSNMQQYDFTKDLGAFDGMLSSFIQDDRLDYTGRPPGFSAYGPDNGTLDNDTTQDIASELRKREVTEENIARVEALAASGASLTIGSVVQALRGDLRFTEALEGEERTNFKLALGKLGFTAAEQEEMLSMSDSADTKALLSRIIDKLGKMEGTVDFDKKEFSALLKGLDASEKTKNPLLELFKGDASKSLSAKDIDQLLTNVRTEQGARELSNMHAIRQVRSAVDTALSNSKVRDLTAPVEDTRGNRLLEQREALMQESTRKNTGIDRLQSPDSDGEASTPENGKGFGSNAKNFGGADDFSGSGDDAPKSRSQRILDTQVSMQEAKGFAPVADKARAKESPQIKNIVAAPVSQPGTQSQQPLAQTLNNTSKGHRQEIFSQVEQGILKTAQNGSQRLTLQLNPNEMGQVTVALTMHKGELKATIRAEQPEAASLLKEQMAELKAALEAEGIKVKELDVQTGLREESGAQWEGAEGHNMLRDAEERNRMLRLSSIRRDAANQAEQNTSLEGREKESQGAGLHIVA